MHVLILVYILTDVTRKDYLSTWAYVTILVRNAVFVHTSSLKWKVLYKSSKHWQKPMKQPMLPTQT